MRRPDCASKTHTAWVADEWSAHPARTRCKNLGAGLVQVRVDASNGLSLGPGCEAESTRNLAIARWPSLAYPWLSREMRQQSSIPALSPACRSDSIAQVQELRIDGIANNSVVARAPNSNKPASVRLRALGATGEVQWLVNGRLESTTQGTQSFEHQFTESGDQAITAMTQWRKGQGRCARVARRALLESALTPNTGERTAVLRFVSPSDTHELAMGCRPSRNRQAFRPRAACDFELTKASSR